MAAAASVANDAGLALYDRVAIDGWAWNDLEKDGVQVGGEDKFAGQKVHLQRRAMDADKAAVAGVGSSLTDGVHGSNAMLEARSAPETSQEVSICRNNHRAGAARLGQTTGRRWCPAGGGPDLCRGLNRSGTR